MSKKQICIYSFIFVLSAILLFANQDNVFEEFNKQLTENNLVFTMPANFTSVKIDSTKCEDVNYFYAIKHKKDKVEIRYSIFRYDQVLKEGDPLSLSLMFSVVENITGDDKILKFAKLGKDKGDKEFNADFGATILVNPKSDFGRGYKYAMIIALFKNDSRSIYITYLFDNLIELKPVFLQSMYSLKFNL